VKLHSRYDPYVFLVLPVTVYVFVVSLPIVFSVYYSFMDWTGMTRPVFIGFDNFKRMLSDNVLLASIVNNLKYTAINTVYQVGFGLVMAIVIQRLVFGQNLVRVLLFSPVIISTMAISQTFRRLLALNPDGVVNALLVAVGLEEMRAAFLADIGITLYVVSMVEAYKYSGLYLVIFYTAFKAIDRNVIEAATIDGTGGWQMYFHIKLPIIRPVIISSLVLVVMGTLKSFDIPFILTNGGPGNASELMATYMYKVAFNRLDYGYGSAIRILIIVISILAVGIITFLAKPKEAA